MAAWIAPEIAKLAGVGGWTSEKTGGTKRVLWPVSANLAAEFNSVLSVAKKNCGDGFWSGANSGFSRRAHRTAKAARPHRGNDAYSFADGIMSGISPSVQDGDGLLTRIQHFTPLRVSKQDGQS